MKEGEDLFGQVYQRNEIIFNQGDPGETMYIIQSGAVEVTSMLENKEIVLAILEEGDFVGEMALLDERPRSSTITTLQRTRLLPINKKSLLQRIQSDPNVVFHLMKIIVQRIRDANVKMQKFLNEEHKLLDNIKDQTKTRLNVQAKNDLPKELNLQIIDSLKKLFPEQQNYIDFKPNEEIFSQGELGNEMYIIVKGTVNLFQKVLDKEQSIATLQGPDFFGEMGLISNSPRSTSAHAASSTQLLVIEQRDFLERIQTHPELALYVLQILIQRLRQTISVLTETQKIKADFEQRLISVLKREDKTSISFISLSSCSGCLAILFDNQNLLTELLKMADIVYCPMLMDQEKIELSELAIIDGVVRTKEDKEKLKEARRKSKYVLAWGTCATYGGIPTMANQYELEELIQETYGQADDAFTYYFSGSNELNPFTYQKEGLELLRRSLQSNDVIKVDYYIPGCPPSFKILIQFLQELRGERQVLSKRQLVCGECNKKPSNEKKENDGYQIFPCNNSNQTMCFSSNAILCLGLITRGGCGAVCIDGGTPCWGCRGPSEKAYNKIRDGENLDQILIEAFLKRGKLGNDQAKSIVRDIRIQANNLINFYQNKLSDQSKVR